VTSGGFQKEDDRGVNLELKKSNHILMTRKDEEVFSREIVCQFPSVVFIDDMIWKTAIAPARESITECKSKFVYLWNQEVYPMLAGIQRADGRFQGPQSGIVIQFVRPTLKEDVLLSGVISVGFQVTDNEMGTFVKGVWKILYRLTHNKLVQVDPKSNRALFPRSDIRAGDDAIAWCNQKSKRFFMFNNTPLIHLRPDV